MSWNSTMIMKFIKFGLKKKQPELTALDIVRIQIEFNVSYSAAVRWLHEIGFISPSHKNELFNQKQEKTSATLFKIVDANDKLLQPSNVIKVPAKYYEFVISNYEKNYIPFSSLQKALALLGLDATLFKKEDSIQDEVADLDIDDIFEEFE